METTTINSRWEFDIGSPDNRTLTIKTKTLLMKKTEKILYFVGGPTGNEAYYIDTLLETATEKSEISICQGTQTGYPSCYVPWKDVLEFIKK